MDASLAAWVPSNVLAGVLLIVLVSLFRRHSSDMREIRDALKTIVVEQQSVRLTLKDHATVEQLGRMGDRFDGRVTGLAQEVAIIKAVMAK